MSGPVTTAELAAQLGMPLADLQARIRAASVREPGPDADSLLPFHWRERATAERAFVRLRRGL